MTSTPTGTGAAPRESLPIADNEEDPDGAHLLRSTLSTRSGLR